MQLSGSLERFQEHMTVYLVTGGAGFIGSHLVDALVEQGNRVEVLDDLSTGSLRNLGSLLDHPLLSIRQGSILDEDMVRKAVERADVVVHLAASVGVQRIIERPLESLMNNIRGTEVVLQACADFGRKVLIASTSEIYGKNAFGPLTEEADRILGSPFKSRWAYSTSKAVDEILAHAYWRERNTPSIVVRLFNTVGPRQTGAYGMVLPRFVQQALEGFPLTVYGTGEQRRCFCHVGDVVRALTGLLDEPASIGGVFNVGSPEEISINGLAELVIRMTGSSSPIVHIPYDEAYEEGFEDMERRVPDTTRIRDLIGWVASRTLEGVILDVVRFERDRIGSPTP
jgi:UDP-glucose 4-epimerase